MPSAGGGAGMAGMGRAGTAAEETRVHHASIVLSSWGKEHLVLDLKCIPLYLCRSLKQSLHVPRGGQK